MSTDTYGELTVTFKDEGLNPDQLAKVEAFISEHQAGFDWLVPWGEDKADIAPEGFFVQIEGGRFDGEEAAWWLEAIEKIPLGDTPIWLEVRGDFETEGEHWKMERTARYKGFNFHDSVNVYQDGEGALAIGPVKRLVEAAEKLIDSYRTEKPVRVYDRTVGDMVDDPSGKTEPGWKDDTPSEIHMLSWRTNTLKEVN